MDWQPIETAPKDETIMFANFTERCLLTNAPHVWTGTLVTALCDFEGKNVEALDEPMMVECSHAAMNENGEPTHWMPLPPPPKDTP